MDEVEPEIEAFVPEDRRRNRVDAAATDVQTETGDACTRPPLFGVPIGVKDIFHVDGLPTRAGSSLPPEVLSGPEADVVTRFRDHGALVLGKTVTTEFAYFDPGPTRNPHDLDHTPGGSSSGSAAAVAAGECPLAIGSQTIGSVIRPAAFCGIIGFKPSYERIPTAGALPLAESADHVGLFTQDISGMRLAASIACDEWVDPEPGRDPILGIPTGAYVDQASDIGQDHFQSVVDSLAQSGYDVRRVELFEDIATINDRLYDLVAAEAAMTHRGLFEDFSDCYHDRMVELIERGRRVDVGELEDARDHRLASRKEIQATMEENEVDLWLSPAAPGPAPEGLDGTGDPVMNLPWTNAGVPSVALPTGTVEGLPLGLQVTAPFGADERLLAWSEGLATTIGSE